jgi:hypothetical protein
MVRGVEPVLSRSCSYGEPITQGLGGRATPMLCQVRR